MPAVSMVVYNAASRELTAKIVYYGPGLSGKTTNLQVLHRRLEPASVGNLMTLTANADRTIFFDLLPVELGDLKGYRIRFQVATVPGQSPYNETRKLVLRGADGVVFVADSRWSMLPKNVESLQNLRENLRAEGVDPAALPTVVQFNKRDLPDALAVDALQEGIGIAKIPFVEAVASDGRGVVETFKLISKLTFVDIVRRIQQREQLSVPEPEAANLRAWKESIKHSASTAAPAAAASEEEPFPAPHPAGKAEITRPGLALEPADEPLPPPPAPRVLPGAPPTVTAPFRVSAPPAAPPAEREAPAKLAEPFAAARAPRAEPGEGADRLARAIEDLRRDWAASRLSMDARIEHLRMTMEGQQADVAAASERAQEAAALVEQITPRFESAMADHSARLASVEEGIRGIRAELDARISRLEQSGRGLEERAAELRESLRGVEARSHEALARALAAAAERLRNPGLE